MICDYLFLLNYLSITRVKIKRRVTSFDDLYMKHYYSKQWHLVILSTQVTRVSKAAKDVYRCRPLQLSTPPPPSCMPAFVHELCPAHSRVTHSTFPLNVLSQDSSTRPGSFSRSLPFLLNFRKSAHKGHLDLQGLDHITHEEVAPCHVCLLYTSPSPRDRQKSRMPSSA